MRELDDKRRPSLVYGTEYSKPVLCDDLEGWGGEGGGRWCSEWGGPCIPMANSY